MTAPAGVDTSAGAAVGDRTSAGTVPELSGVSAVAVGARPAGTSAGRSNAPAGCDMPGVVFASGCMESGITSEPASGAKAGIATSGAEAASLGMENGAGAIGATSGTEPTLLALPLLPVLLRGIDTCGALLGVDASSLLGTPSGATAGNLLGDVTWVPLDAAMPALPGALAGTSVGVATLPGTPGGTLRCEAPPRGRRWRGARGGRRPPLLPASPAALLMGLVLPGDALPGALVRAGALPGTGLVAPAGKVSDAFAGADALSTTDDGVLPGLPPGISGALRGGEADVSAGVTAGVLAGALTLPGNMLGLCAAGTSAIVSGSGVCALAGASTGAGMLSMADIGILLRAAPGMSAMLGCSVLLTPVGAAVDTLSGAVLGT